jgi:hypothetical protein
VLKLILSVVGWKPLAVAGGGVLLSWIGLGGALGWQTLQLSWAREEVAEQKAQLVDLKHAVEARDVQLAQAERSIATCTGANEGQARAIDRMLAGHRDELAALSAERDRIARQKQQVKVIKEKVDVEAQRCAGDVHPAIRAAVEWVRVKDQLDTGRAAEAGDGRGREDRAGQSLPAR